MHNKSRGLRERVVRGLARASLALTLTLLGALFMSTAASAAAPVTKVASSQAPGPSLAGTVLSAVVLAIGIAILTYGSLRSGRGDHHRRLLDRRSR